MSRIMRLAEHVARMGGMRYALKILVGKPEGKGPFEKPRRSCVYNIRIGLRKIGRDCVD
jgi:hypothetical protein